MTDEQSSPFDITPEAQQLWRELIEQALVLSKKLGRNKNKQRMVGVFTPEAARIVLSWLIRHGFTVDLAAPYRGFYVLEYSVADNTMTRIEEANAICITVYNELGRNLATNTGSNAGEWFNNPRSVVIDKADDGGAAPNEETC